MSAKLTEISENLVKVAVKKGAEQSQVTTFLTDSALTRFAASQIHQNVATKVQGIIIKAIIDKRIGVARINSLDMTLAEEAVNQALATAKMVPPIKHFKSLPEPKDWKPIKGAVDRETAYCQPEERAEKVSELISEAHSISPAVKAVAGSVSTGLYGFAVANSLGLSAHASFSLATLETTIISEDSGRLSFGTGEEVSRRLSDITVSEIGRQTAENSVRGLNPARLTPGTYEAILMPLAGSVALSSVGGGFTGLSWQSGASFVKHHLGQKAFDEKLSAFDDARDPRTSMAVPIDGEGTPKTRKDLITKGVVNEQSICYDSITASKEQKTSSGHSPIPVGTGYGMGGASPMNVIVAPGDSSLDEMIRETKRGVLVTMFHYNAVVDETEVIISGLTRNGTFLIEKGEIVKPVMNLRYTDSMLKVLKDIPLISKSLKTSTRITLPILKVSALRFTGATEY